MNEQRNNGRGVFYGVIGVATLVVAIIGATFAYFTASASINNVITGNMASVNLSLSVTPVKTANSGMIPMSNSMVEAAVNDAENDVCVDDNGNEVCQIYKIVIDNNSSAGQFVDGYVSLRFGSGAPTDYVMSASEASAAGEGAKEGDSKYVSGALFDNSTKAAAETGVGTTMRWAQVFTTDAGANYSTAGTQTIGAEDEVVEFDDPISDASSTAHNTENIMDVYTGMTGTTIEDFAANDKGVLVEETIAETPYNVIGRNYIRVSNHDWSQVDSNGNQSYTRAADVTSALVFNHSIAAGDQAEYYIVVWLSETGTNQTAGADTTGGTTASDVLSFFDGNVTFISAQGSEVSATFSGYAKVERTDY